MLWDIFCNVIDNHGDIGVCWRLAAQLAARGESVRLRVDDASALAWLAPQGCPGVQVLPWESAPPQEPGDVVVEAFGCELPEPFQAAIATAMRARGRQPAWINLEYLTAESFAQRCHGLASPVLSGPAAGLAKRFFYPGFTPGTGGLLREPDLMERQARFDRDAWLSRQGIKPPAGSRCFSLFCYEPEALDRLLGQLARDPVRTCLLATAGRASAAAALAMERVERRVPGWNAAGRLTIVPLPLLTQIEFDRLLWSCDLNFVRGEDSVVRALWAGKPLVWQIYPQQDKAHHAKLDAFLDWLAPPASLRAFHLAWNGIAGALPPIAPAAWRTCVQQARSRLLAQEDLAAQLTRFAARFAVAGATP